ncbi:MULTISPECIES: site-2 protease family protein [unclassified Virgibacillus]|uniref:site-2 protease family protein n=1 Tax=unclassified Virgibacillus TaxID=2620237 RepID=UPI0024DE38B9|nr:site-2 protease family protein [Virgibacillus sp. LDC-1]
MTTLLFILLFILLIAPISNTIHECGHMIGARITGADHMLLSIGIGKPIATFSLRRVTVTIHLFYFLGGMATNVRSIPYRPFEMAIITIGGPFFSILCAFVVGLLMGIYPNEILLLFLLFNLWIGIINLIPFKRKDKKSDGYILFKLIFKE